MKQNGYDEDGNRLEDTWAYDSLHEAGRYVLFGKTGEVLQKAEEWEKKEQVSENFTVTNQNTGTVAIRAKVFEDFADWTEQIPAVNYGLHTYAVEDIMTEAVQSIVKGADMEKTLQNAQSQAEAAVG